MPVDTRGALDAEALAPQSFSKTLNDVFYQIGIVHRFVFSVNIKSHHCLRALRILNLIGVILRHLLPVMHKSGTKNIATI